MKTRLFACLSLFAFLAISAQAQPPERGGPGGGRGFGPAFYLAEESVQADLKLSDEAKAKCQELLDKQRAAFEELQGLSREERREKMAALQAQIQAELEKLLDPNQVKRLKQITLQVRGPQAFRDPEVVAALKLTDDQVAKLDGINEDLRAEMRDIFQEAGGDLESVREELAQIRKDASAKAEAVLDDAQKATWKELQGEPFQGEIRRGFGGGRGRRGGAE